MKITILSAGQITPMAILPAVVIGAAQGLSDSSAVSAPPTEPDPRGSNMALFQREQINS
jgi:hypothetical protein